MAAYLALAFLSGIPALVYEVVWTREVGLLVGAQIEAISAVLVAFFGGLALGTRLLGPGADRSAQPLARYAALEATAGLLAIASTFALRALGSVTFAGMGNALLLAVACALLLPVTTLLGGTLAALLRAAVRDVQDAPRVAAALSGANTAGAVAGVACAAAAIPLIGLRASLLCAGLAALVVAGVAWRFVGSIPNRVPQQPIDGVSGTSRPPLLLLLGAGLAGASTLAYEVLTARGAGLRLGSSLFAWALVLGLFLAGLGIGNLALARLAGRTRQPERSLAWLELAAALAIAAGAAWLLPGVTAPATGLGSRSIAVVAAAVLPPAILMGAAFPLFVRLAHRPLHGIARSFSEVSAANTAGGIAGTLLAPFVLLPGLGLRGAALACVVSNALIGIVLLARTEGGALRRAQRVAFASAGVLGVCLSLAGLGTAQPSGGTRVLFVEHGSQASVVVTHDGRRRDLLVDGDPEASTGGSARRTEELLAVLPLLLHPKPRTLLEVGFGSGITLGTAARFPFEEIQCVEISASVLRAAPFFAPDNRGVAAGGDPRVRITRDDGRAFVARHPASYDVVVANTLHPWSLAATGLYSREYFERMASALRPGGLAVQWLPVQRIGADALEAILRTILAVFPHGSLWWGYENILVVARREEVMDAVLLQARAREPEIAEVLRALGLAEGDDLRSRKLGSFAAARRAVGAGLVLSDDRPSLERIAAGRHSEPAAELGVVARIAAEAASENEASGALRLWLESRLARTAGQEEEADRKEARAAAAGLRPALDARTERLELRAARAVAEGQMSEGEQWLQRALESDPAHRDARFALAILRAVEGRKGDSLRELDRLIARDPADAEAWNQRGTLLYEAGDQDGARQAFDRALEADPYLIQALGNAGLLAVDAGDTGYAQRLLERLRAISPLGTTREERALAEALLRS